MRARVCAESDGDAIAAWSCAQLIHRYANLTDAGDWPGVAAMFAEDGMLIRPSAPDASVTGRGAILAALQARPPRIGRHFVTNADVRVLSSDRATARSSMILYTGVATEGDELPEIDGPPRLGGFEDELARIEGRWFFTARRGVMYFR